MTDYHIFIHLHNLLQKLAISHIICDIENDPMEITKMNLLN